MFTLLKYLFRTANEPKQLGANLDLRLPEDRIDDIHLHDIVANANAVLWKEKTEIRKFPILDQNQSYMCGANALAKALGIIFNNKFGSYIAFSRADIYQRRYNKPEGGMSMPDMFRIAGEGVTLEQLTPKEILTDADADTMVIEGYKKDIGKTFAIKGGGVYLPSDIDTIASVIQTTGKSVILLTYFNAGEWSKEYPSIVDRNLTVFNGLRHFVDAVDFVLIGGKKYLVVEDSAHFGNITVRYVSEEWVSKRVYGAGYPMNFKFQAQAGDRPTYNNLTVISAQECLRFEGCFPINVDYFESIGPTTRKALLAFQMKYGLAQTSQLDQATRAKLMALYP